MPSLSLEASKQAKLFSCPFDSCALHFARSHVRCGANAGAAYLPCTESCYSSSPAATGDSSSPTAGNSITSTGISPATSSNKAADANPNTSDPVPNSAGECAFSSSGCPKPATGAQGPNPSATTE
uniref:Uncharacterized protein n=1 Tax=Leersia perrieri TaxID=77586 RepID=A0A0D9V5P1_9ORYZ